MTTQHWLSPPESSENSITQIQNVNQSSPTVTDQLKICIPNLFVGCCHPFTLLYYNPYFKSLVSDHIAEWIRVHSWTVKKSESSLRSGKTNLAEWGKSSLQLRAHQVTWLTEQGRRRSDNQSLLCAMNNYAMPKCSDISTKTANTCRGIN